MKKLIIILSILTLPTQLFALPTIDYKLTVGGILAPTIASEIKIDNNNGGYDLVDYEGNPGYEIGFSVLINDLELSYIIQNYAGFKDTASEVGDITFEIETVEATLYWANPRKNDGFNTGLGVGKGIGNITVNKAVGGTPVISNGVAFVKEYHFNLSVLYHFSSSSLLTLKYTAQNLFTVTGSPFVNTLGSLAFSYQF